MSDSKKIVHIIPSFFPDIGGAEKQLERLAKEQIKKGLKVNILTRIPKNKNKLNNFKEVLINRFNRNMLLFNLQCLFYLIRNRDFIKVLHVHTLSSVAFTAMLFCTIFNKKILVKLTRIGTSSQIDLIKNSTLKNFLFKILITKSSPIFVCLTNESKAYLEKTFFNKNNLVIHNGISISKAKKINYDDNFIRILFVSRLIKRKRVYSTLKQIFKTDYKNLKIILCGDGPESKKIIELQKKYPEIIDFRGIQDDNEIILAMRESDYFIQNSVNEGLSNSFLEALNFNVIPVVGKLTFYQNLKDTYGIPIFFEEFLNMSTNEKLQFKKINRLKSRLIASEKFNIKLTEKLLFNAYFKT